MKRILLNLILLVVFCLPFQAFAQQSGGGADDDVKTACEISGGDWTTSNSGWACCWADWGCYGCVNGVCKIKCHNQRCRKANGISRAMQDTQKVPGLAPAGMKAPVAPKMLKKMKPAAAAETMKN